VRKHVRECPNGKNQCSPSYMVAPLLHISWFDSSPFSLTTVHARLIGDKLSSHPSTRADSSPHMPHMLLAYLSRDPNTLSTIENERRRVRSRCESNERCIGARDARPSSARFTDDYRPDDACLLLDAGLTGCNCESKPAR